MPGISINEHTWLTVSMTRPLLEPLGKDDPSIENGRGVVSLKGSNIKTFASNFLK